MKNSIIKSKYIYSTITVVLLLISIFILSKIINNTFIFPTFQMVIDGAKIVLIDNYQAIPELIIFVIISLLISFIYSFIILVIYILNKNLIGFFTPILSFFHVVPTMAISVYLFLILDKNEKFLVPIILAIMVTTPIIVEGLITSYDNIDKGIEDVLKLEQISFFKKVFKIYIPLMLPYILMVLLQSISLGIKAVVMGEFIGYQQTNSHATLGGILYSNQVESGVIVFILILLFVISVICEVVIKILQIQINKNLVK